MAEEPEGEEEGVAGGPVLEMGFQAGVVSAWIRINDRPLAANVLRAIGAAEVGLVGGIGLAVFFRRNPVQVVDAITRALRALGRALNFRGGSVVFELRCDVELFSQLPLESFTTEIKGRGGVSRNRIL